MKASKKLEKVIVLSMLLAASGYGTVMAAPITSGTHDIGGTYTLTGDFVHPAKGTVVLNATSDVNFVIPSDESFISNVTKDATVIVNMNNHTFTEGTTGALLYMRGYTGNVNKILNAYDINSTSTTSNNINCTANNGSFELQANHDINFKQPVFYSPMYVPKGVTGTLTAGNNITCDVFSNPVQVDGGVLDVNAGNNIILICNSKYAGVFVSQSTAKLSLTAQNGAISVLANDGGTSGAVTSLNGANVVVKAAKDITIGGKAKRGVRAEGGTIDITSATGSIYVTATDTTNNINSGIYAAKSGTYVGTVNLNSDTSVSAAARAVYASGGNITFAKALTIPSVATAIAADKAGTVTATDTASAKKITGSITSDGVGSTVDVNLETDDSYLTGVTTVSNSGVINLNFANGSEWYVTGDSSLTNLVNNSTVDMRYTGKTVNETLTTANLAGNGNYILNTDLQASYDSKDVQNNGDKIIITASSSGNNILELRDVSLDTKLQSQGYLLLVEDQSNGGATFSGKDLAHGGIFKYAPVITTANPTDYTGYNAGAKNWYLTGFEKLIEVSDNTKATLGLSGTRYANYFMDNDTLLKRLGELRTIKGEPEENGIWARYRHGGMDGDGFSGGSTMVQVGYDKKTSNKRYTGFAFNHTSSTYDFDGGATGEGSQDALTVYNTWLGDKNHYFDIVGKIGKMRGDSTYEDSLFPEKNHYDNWYYSISGEYGRKNIDKNGWYYEPQAQLTLGRINEYDVTTTMGTKVNMGSITSLISRAGVTFGKEYNMKDANTHSNIYGKINWLHEFKGDVHTSLLDTYGDSYEHEKDYGGSWWNVGLGATINVNKNTHMYLDFERNFGGEVTTNWIGQLGCQWTWK